jgi:hypothetical protein
MGYGIFGAGAVTGIAAKGFLVIEASAGTNGSTAVEGMPGTTDGI